MASLLDTVAHRPMLAASKRKTIREGLMHGVDCLENQTGNGNHGYSRSLVITNVMTNDSEDWMKMNRKQRRARL